MTQNGNGKQEAFHTTLFPGGPRTSGLSAAYGATVLGRGAGPEDTIKQSLHANALPHPSVAGPVITEVKPHDQITQLVSGFLNGVIEHIVRRVVSELEPKLVDAWTMTRVEHQLRAKEEAFDPMRRRSWCPGGENVCDLCILKRSLAAHIVPDAERWGCNFRLAIDSRLFIVTKPQHMIEMAEITTDNRKIVRASSTQAIADLVRLMFEGATLDQAVDESTYIVEVDEDAGPVAITAAPSKLLAMLEGHPKIENLRATTSKFSINGRVFECYEFSDEAFVEETTASGKIGAVGSLENVHQLIIRLILGDSMEQAMQASSCVTIQEYEKSAENEKANEVTEGRANVSFE